jgi:hypothetical protein
MRSLAGLNRWLSGDILCGSVADRDLLQHLIFTYFAYNLNDDLEFSRNAAPVDSLQKQGIG